MKKFIISTIILSILFSCKKETPESAGKFQMIQLNNELNHQLTAPELSDPDFKALLKVKLDNLSKLITEFPGSIIKVRTIEDKATEAKMPMDCNIAYTINVKGCTKSYEASISNADAVYDSPGMHSVQIADNMIRTARHNYSVCLTQVQETHNSCH